MSQVGLFQPVVRVCVEERQKETKGVGSSLCSLLEINGPDFANATRSVGSSRPSSTFLSTLVSSNFSPSLKLSHFSQFSYLCTNKSTLVSFNFSLGLKLSHSSQFSYLCTIYSNFSNRKRNKEYQ